MKILNGSSFQYKLLDLDNFWREINFYVVNSQLRKVITTSILHHFYIDWYNSHNTTNVLISEFQPIPTDTN